MPEVHFPGPEGRLEGRYHPQPEKDAPMLGDAGRPPQGFTEVQGKQQTGYGLAEGSELAIRSLSVAAVKQPSIWFKLLA